MEALGADRVPILNDAAAADIGGVRKRPKRQMDSEGRWLPPEGSDWNPDLPYGGKVYLARRKKPDTWLCFAAEVTILLATAAFAYYSYYHFEHLHYHVTKGYAHLGYSVAQHQIGHKLLNGVGVEKDPHTAMEWFKKAADQGHPEASYSLAVGHVNGIRKDLLAKGEATKLIAHAAANGVPEAIEALNNHCANGRCD